MRGGPESCRRKSGFESGGRLTSVLALVALFIVASEACRGGHDAPDADIPKLTIYCGATMVSPVTELADRFAREKGCRVDVLPGGSNDLYENLKKSRTGDLYLPGSHKYYEKFAHEGLLREWCARRLQRPGAPRREGQPEGNHRGHPQHHEAELPRRHRQRRGVQHGALHPRPSSRSWASTRRPWRTLSSSSPTLGPSRGSSRAGSIDLALGWRAIVYVEENQRLMELVASPELRDWRDWFSLSLLGFSKEPELARAFLELAASPEGQELFFRYGFLDEIGGGLPCPRPVRTGDLRTTEDAHALAQTVHDEAATRLPGASSRSRSPSSSLPTSSS